MTSQQETVLVTGSSSGFGRLISETLARKGRNVFASMRGVDGKNAKAAEELRALAEKDGLAIDVVEIDISDDASVRAGVDYVKSSADALDVVVNNAGICSMGITEAFSVSQLQEIFNVNLWGLMRVNQAALPQMRRQGHGLIINISSTLGRVVLPFSSGYVATKWAIEAFTEGLHYELKPHGIDVVSVQPGAFGTNLLGANLVQPADAELAGNYGPTTGILEGYTTGLQEFAKDLPDAQIVADKIAEIVEAPAGSRALRNVVGVGPDVDGAALVNRTYAEAQGPFMQAFGLGELSAD